MTAPTITGTLPFLRSPARPRPPPAPRPPPVPRRFDRTQRMVALAHHIDRLVQDGALADYAAAARRLGVSSPRITQILDLTLLAPDLQERVLLGTLNVPERRLRRALRLVDWNQQRAAIEGLIP